MFHCPARQAARPQAGEILHYLGPSVNVGQALLDEFSPEAEEARRLAGLVDRRLAGSIELIRCGVPCAADIVHHALPYSPNLTLKNWVGELPGGVTSIVVITALFFPLTVTPLVIGEALLSPSTVLAA